MVHLLKTHVNHGAFLVAVLLFSIALWGCGGGGGSGGVSIEPGAKEYTLQSTTTFTEVPAIDVLGGGVLSSTLLNFNPKGPKGAELYDSDEDGIPDKLVNSYQNYINAANRMFDADEAACYGSNTGVQVWTSAYQPNTMPPGTAGMGTQYIQIVFPFNLDPGSVFNAGPLNVGNDFLRGSVAIYDEDGAHVNCTVLLNGKDAKWYYDPVANPLGDDYVNDPNWPAEITIAPNVLVIIAQAQLDQALGTLPATPTAFCSTLADPANWDADKKEIRIAISEVRDSFKNPIMIDSKHYIVRSDLDPINDNDIKPLLGKLDISAVEILGEDTGPFIPIDDNLIVSRDTSFLITFNKPVVPETVGRSIIFDRPPFNANTKVVPNTWALITPDPGSVCYNLTSKTPIGTNISLIAFYNDTYGASTSKAVIPFRCHPVNQNNLATYVIDPIISLPGSTPAAFAADNPIKIRLQVTVYESGLNGVTADPDGTGSATPVNLGPSSYFGETFKPGGIIQRTFTVQEGGRYVNAPVSPNALYYSMGPKGIGVVDLDGNGFTTNHPNFTKTALVTSIRFYSNTGKAGAQPNVNKYAYGAKANPASPVGLGAKTSVPGINEGSGEYNEFGVDDTNGMEKVVRDSLGRSQLFPDPDGDIKFYNISDIEIGDFLDAIFYDTGNFSAQASKHVSFLRGLGLDFANNLIDMPPTPNPPPLSLPIGMRATDVIVDEMGIVKDGAFVIMGKEVFTTGVHRIWFPTTWPQDTLFVHLQPADEAGSSKDEPYPPNPCQLVNPVLTDFVNLGPLAESCTIYAAPAFASRQQIGNFLFAADKGNNEVKIINSNNMDMITSISGFSQPDSLIVSGDLETLYVSNSGSSTVSVFDANPKSATFLQHIADVAVGNQPKGMCCQPDLEDIFVCNYGSNSISILNRSTNTVRKTITSLLNKPWDMAAGPRQNGLGFGTQVFHGYITNYGGDNVLVYESGPDGFGGVGYDDILGPIPEQSGVKQWEPIQRPRGICWDPHFYQPMVLSGGAFVAHMSGSLPVVSRIAFSKQQAPYGPIYLQPISGAIGGTPGFGKRVFEIAAQWGGKDNPLSVNSGAATDVALLDYNRKLWLNNNWTGDPWVTNYGAVGGNPFASMPHNNKHPMRFLNIYGNPAYYPVHLPDRLFISFEFSPKIDVIDPMSGTKVTTITGLSAPATKMKNFFKF